MISFCKEKNIATKGVLAITIQQNRTGEFCSLIIDMDSRTIADMYPVDDLSDYKEGSIRKGATGQFLYCYHANLDPSKLESKSFPVKVEESISKAPFCCSSLKLYKPCRTAHDDKFVAPRTMKTKKIEEGHFRSEGSGRQWPSSIN